MLKACTKGFDLLRLIVLAAALLLVPLTAFADGLEHHDPKPAGQAAAGHQANAAMDAASGHHSAPVEVPLHCHEKSPSPQAAALVLEPISRDQPLPVIDSAPPLFWTATPLLIRSAARIPIAGPPRFILFSNFRS